MDVRGAKIPFETIDAVFFDVGGTVLTIDFAQVQGALASQGYHFTQEQLQREEARARPVVSGAILQKGGQAEDFFSVYLGAILAGLDFPSEHERAEKVALLRQDLIPPFGNSDRLWNRPIEKADAALTSLAELGLTLVAVSNSDGSAARSLERAGLIHHFEAVIDSHEVGHAKPDPRIFEPALALVNARPEQTIYVGDIYAGDIVGCRAAGLHGLLYNPYGDYKDMDCEMIACLTEIAPAIERAR